MAWFLVYTGNEIGLECHLHFSHCHFSPYCSFVKFIFLIPWVINSENMENIETMGIHKDLQLMTP